MPSMNALNLCNNRGSEMWILSCENIWGKYEIWELAGFYTTCLPAETQNHKKLHNPP